ncbi:hypothetical protein SAMN05192553_101658 [Cyclobacterium xiamenense]|uniref:Uncharacterized protein n=1 Tax=Cyclobacterium xiamenense TaxID=1297121 RepID=A0A1H6UHY1_9BACT|nr:hypothetical protein SAMN05192553_101658 [Cyclobacterium xiamenense]
MVSPGFKPLLVGVNRFAISLFFETRPGSLHELCLVLAYEVNVFAVNQWTMGWVCTSSVSVS